MPSIYALKPRFQALLRPIAARLAAAGITANNVTLAAAVASIAYAAAIAATHGAPALLIGLPALLFARMALNAIDGMLAREFNQKTDLGLVLNELGDVVSDAALYLAFAFVAGFDPILIAVFTAVAITTEFTGLLAIPLGQERNYAGPFGKSDRAAFIGAIAFLIGAGLEPGQWVDIALGAAIVLSLITVIKRARQALKA